MWRKKVWTLEDYGGCKFQVWSFSMWNLIVRKRKYIFVFQQFDVNDEKIYICNIVLS